MKKCLIRNDFRDFNFRELCGVNLLAGLTPIVVNFNNEELTDTYGDIAEISSKNNLCSDNFISINSDSCIIIYDIKKSISLDRILICGAYDDNSDICLSEYELYFSQSLEDIFERDNQIVKYNNSNLWESSETRNGCDQIFDIEDYKGRYFAIKINISNPTDKMIRLSYVGLFNHDFTEQITFCKRNFGENILQGKIPTAKGTYTADLSCLTNGKCFDKETRIAIDTETSYTFKLDNEITADSFYIVGSESAINSCKIYASTDKDKLMEPESQLNLSAFPKPTSQKEVSAGICMTDLPIKFNYIAFVFDKGTFLEQVGIVPYETIEEDATNN